MRNWTLGTIAFSLFLLGGCAKETKPQAISPQASEGPQPQVISTFTLVGNTPTGRKKWEVQGQTANLIGDVVDLSPVEAKSFGQVEVILTAKRGWFHRNNRNIELEGDVVALTSDGARLVTDTFQWKGDRQTGRTEDWVTVTRPGMTVFGKGGVTFPKMKRVHLAQEVTVTLWQEGKEGKTLITCDGPMEVDYGRNKARFWRNVHVRDAKGTLRSDRMDVRFNRSKSQLLEVHCWGHVEIADDEGKKNAFSDRAHSWRTIGKTLLFGHPKLAMVSESE
jgi:LPS export ABC transporter protein LptC